MFKKLLMLLICGFIFGILIASFYIPNSTVQVFTLLIPVVILFLISVDRTSWKIYVCIVSVLFGLSLGILRYQLVDSVQNDFLKEGIDSQVSLVGQISEEPDVRDTSTRLSVLIDTLNDNTQNANVKILAIVNKYPEYKYGERIRLSGKLQKPAIIETDKGAFDWGEFLAKDDIHYILYRPNIEIIAESKFSLIGSLVGVKHSFMKKLQGVLPEPHASLEAGLILGAKQSLGRDLLEQFRRTGLIHMVVLSGQNLSIISDWTMRLLAFLPLYARLVCGAVGLILFTLMTGGQAATVRAAIMALIAMLARSTGRAFNATIALIAAGVLMIFWNPKLLVFDTGFQLSFLATLGLIYFSPILEEKLSMIPKWKWLDLRGIISATLSAQFAVTPWILYKLGTFSVVSIPANFLVLPVVPLAMASGFISGGLAYISHIIALPFAYLTYLVLGYMLYITKVFASISFASLEFDHVSILIPIICYGLSVYFLWRQKKSADRSRRLASEDQR